MSVSERFYSKVPMQEDVDAFINELESNGRAIIGKPEVKDAPYGQKGRWLIAIRHVVKPDPDKQWLK